MIGSRLDFSGMLDLDKELALLSKAESNTVKRQAARAGASVFRDEARRNAPVDSGKLKRGIHVAGVKGQPDIAGVAVKKAFYWRFFEYGTSKMPAKAIFRPAFESKQEQAADAAIKQLLAVVDKVLMK